MRNSLSFVKLVKYIEGYSFGEFFNDNNVDDFIDYLYENSEEYQMGEWRCAYGATKLVIIMEKEDFVGQTNLPKDMYMKENGKTIKCMEKVYIYSLMVKYTKVIGIMEICMEKVL